MPFLNRSIAVLPRPVVRRAIHSLWKYQEPELRKLDEYLDCSRLAVDVGAWWGPWTAALARRCPEVHSFEPQPQLAAQLRTWVPSNVVVHETAVGDRSGTAELNRPDDRPGTDGLATLRPMSSTDSETVTVPLATIDSLDLGDVGFMKIDVEGLELAALTGAAVTIERSKPRLMIEIEQRHLDEPMETVFDWLHERAYRGLFLRSKSWHRIDTFDVERDQTAHIDRPKSAAYVNAFLFVPEGDTLSL